MNINSVAIRYVHDIKIGTLQCVLLVSKALYERERESERDAGVIIYKYIIKRHVDI